MIALESYGVSELQAAMLAESGNTGFKGELTQEATGLTVEWWRLTGFGAWTTFGGYAIDPNRKARLLFEDACRYVRPRIQSKPAGPFQFIFIGIVLSAIITAVIEWVVRTLLDYFFHDRQAAAAFAGG